MQTFSSAAALSRFGRATCMVTPLVRKHCVRTQTTTNVVLGQSCQPLPLSVFNTDVQGRPGRGDKRVTLGSDNEVMKFSYTQRPPCDIEVMEFAYTQRPPCDDEVMEFAYNPATTMRKSSSAAALSRFARAASMAEAAEAAEAAGAAEAAEAAEVAEVAEAAEAVTPLVRKQCVRTTTTTKRTTTTTKEVLGQSRQPLQLSAVFNTDVQGHRGRGNKWKALESDNEVMEFRMRTKSSSHQFKVSSDYRDDDDKDIVLIPKAVALDLERVQFLGAGAFGSVVKAQSKQLAKQVAVKVATMGFDRRQKTGRAALETGVLAKLSDEGSEYVVRQYGYHHAQIGLTNYITSVLEVAPNGDFESWLAAHVHGQGNLPLHQRMPRLLQALDIVLTAMQGALDLHEKINMVHRDIKAANILVFGDSNSPFGKIADFGILAKPGEDGQAGSDRTMSPEVYNGGACSYKSDVFSFGIILHEIFSAQAQLSAGHLMKNQDIRYDLLPPSAAETVMDALKDGVSRCDMRALVANVAEVMDVIAKA